MLSDREALLLVTHELRTPLNAILGFGELLALEQLNESQRNSVEQILAGGRHLLALVEDLLDVSWIEHANLELHAVDIREQIAETVAMCGPLAAEGALAIRVDAGEEPLVARADARRLKQVLLNLVSNAIKYNREGGSLTIRARAAGADSIRLDVIDSGSGMTDEQLGRLFRPFDRLDAPRCGINGTGIGLVVTKALVEAMGGTISAASTPGLGSTFTVLMPAAEPSWTTPLRASSPS